MYDVIADLCSAGLALAALGLHAVQHRGQESAGIVAFDGQHFNAHRDLGLVGDIFSSEGVMSRLAGHAAIGHNRYSTTGETALRNVQPLFADLSCGGFALAPRSEERRVWTGGAGPGNYRWSPHHSKKKNHKKSKKHHK